MVCHRSRATRPALALWLFVLLADTAAAGNMTTVGYLLAAVVVAAVALAALWLTTREHHQRKPHPVRVRAARHERWGRRR
ncbi:hypothetical protein Pme01_06640 [Planosporangium mesophilum]|uniref:Uncharacterized protein n=2 Tax=Planosporangium mesophilum TaxID=689768 RepID=A0A8J3WYE2_9ACTN|nr:hypothetical protein Pme01_06640 [Planosporangium mesophilum]